MSWTATTEQGTDLGTFKDKAQIFEALRDQHGLGLRFKAQGTNGSTFLYLITKFGYTRVEESVPEHLKRDGRRRS